MCQLQEDAEELRGLVEVAKRQKVKDVLTVALRKIETEIIRFLQLDDPLILIGPLFQLSIISYLSKSLLEARRVMLKILRGSLLCFAGSHKSIGL